MGVKLRELNSEWNAGEKVYSDDLNDTFDYKIGESRVYSDGISASQLESNNSIQFGQTDAAGKINKLFQSFVANKNSILAVSVKKDTTVYPSLSNSPTLSEYLYSEYDHPSNNNFRDNGVISSSYRQIAWVYMGDNSIRWAKYTKNISDLVVGEEYIFSVEVRNSNLNGSSVVMVVNGSPNTLATTSTFKKFEFKFIASATSTTVELQINNNIVNPNNFSVDFKNAILIRKIAYNKVLNIYADNDGVPSGVSLGTATVLGSAIELIGIGEDIQFIFSPAIEDILDGQRYWISISQETSNDDAYLNLGYNDTEIPNFTLKKWNTTDGYTNVTGALYLKVIEYGYGKIPTLNKNEKINKELLDLSEQVKLGSVSGNFTISTTGSITINHSLGVIPRKMTFFFAGSGSSYHSVVMVNNSTGAIISQQGVGVSDNFNAFSNAANKWAGNFLWLRCSGSSNGTQTCINTMTTITSTNFTFNNPTDTWGNLTGTVYYILEK